MVMLAELRAAGTAALRLPGALIRPGCAAVRDLGRGDVGTATDAHLPVLLVHGYAGTESVWEPLCSALHAVGFDRVFSVSYNSFATDLPQLTAQIAASAQRAVDSTGAAGLHMVGHSLGGLLLRHAIARHRLWDVVSTAVTIATPHSGSRLAQWAPGSCARLMHPGTPLLDAEVSASGTPPRWLSYYSEGDRVVPPGSAQLTDPRLGATNLRIPACGHLTICRDPRLIRSLVGELCRTETDSARRRPVLSLAA